MADKEYLEHELLSCDSCYHHDACKVWVEHCNELLGSIGIEPMDFPFCAVPNRLCSRYQPVADVVEVRHGKWMRTTRAPKSRDGYYFWNKPLETVFVCSECGRVERVEEPYCNCGAKMGGKGEGE